MPSDLVLKPKPSNDVTKIDDAAEAFLEHGLSLEEEADIEALDALETDGQQEDIILT